jgi:hypothetical protein
MGLPFLDLAQCEGSATILFELVGSLSVARPKAEEISMNQHLSGAERRSEPSTGETQAPEFDAMTWGAEQALKAMIEYQVESLRFLARRTYCNLEFLRHMRHCAGWHDMAQVQQSWFKACVADYGEEVARLAGTGFQLARSDFAPLQSLVYRQARGGKGG